MRQGLNISAPTFLLCSLISLTSCFWKTQDRYVYDPVSERQFIIKAQYMQYACGDGADDMRVLEVSDSQYAYLIGMDVDPIIDREQKNLGGTFYENSTDEYGMTYLLTGTVNRCESNGCDLAAPLFWVTNAQLLSGEPIEIYGD